MLTCPFVCGVCPPAARISKYMTLVAGTDGLYSPKAQVFLLSEGKRSESCLRFRSNLSVSPSSLTTRREDLDPQMIDAGHQYSCHDGPGTVGSPPQPRVLKKYARRSTIFRRNGRSLPCPILHPQADAVCSAWRTYSGAPPLDLAVYPARLGCTTLSSKSIQSQSGQPVYASKVSLLHFDAHTLRWWDVPLYPSFFCDPDRFSCHSRILPYHRMRSCRPTS
ncbi:hypothetical protein R3P38DRAFT_1958967 [Favolaschia claudopus]|uniref:Uncharacterized protein n=1 Tax=Favolaschia claudopus TaxID=2862362 RepID=A0AAW0A0M9_9AGAR